MLETIVIGVVKVLAYLIGIAMAVWFYFSAQRQAKDPLKWAAIGAVIFYAVKLPWTLFVVKPNPQYGVMSGTLLSLSSTLVATAVVIAVWLIFLRPRRSHRGTPV